MYAQGSGLNCGRHHLCDNVVKLVLHEIHLACTSDDECWPAVARCLCVCKAMRDHIEHEDSTELITGLRRHINNRVKQYSDRDPRRTLERAVQVFDEARAGGEGPARDSLHELNACLHRASLRPYMTDSTRDLLEEAIECDSPTLLFFFLNKYQLDINDRSFGYGYSTGGNLLGATCLHLAAFKGKAACVSMLLKEGARADVIDDGGQTPLERARGAAVHATFRGAAAQGGCFSYL